MARFGQTGPKDCLHQCGNKRLCWLRVTPAISTLGSHTLEASFCLYAASLLIESMYARYSRLIPHQWKGCYGPVCADPWMPRMLERGRAPAGDRLVTSQSPRVVGSSHYHAWRLYAVPCTLLLDR